jgi:hypothetical protein
MHIQNTPRATQHESYWLVQGEANLIGYLLVWRALFSCSSDIMEAPSVALCAFKMSQKLQLRIQITAGAALFYHIGA